MTEDTDQGLDLDPGMFGWTSSNYDAAADDGWFIGDAEGSENGRWQLQAFDDPDAWGWPPGKLYPFDGDADVWDHVRLMARGGSVLHRHALNVMKSLNPKEYAAIMQRDI